MTHDEILELLYEHFATCTNGELNLDMAADVTRHLHQLAFSGDISEADRNVMSVLFNWLEDVLVQEANAYAALGQMVIDVRDDLLSEATMAEDTDE